MLLRPLGLYTVCLCGFKLAFITPYISIQLHSKTNGVRTAHILILTSCKNKSSFLTDHNVQIQKTQSQTGHVMVLMCPNIPSLKPFDTSKCRAVICNPPQTPVPVIHHSHFLSNRFPKQQSSSTLRCAKNRQLKEKKGITKKCSPWQLGQTEDKAPFMSESHIEMESFSTRCMCTVILAVGFGKQAPAHYIQPHQCSY